MPHFFQGDIEDHRELLEKLRRVELNAIVRNEGIQVPPGSPATVTREIIRQAGVDVTKYIDGNLQFIWPEIKKDSDPTDDIKDIDSMKRPELLKLCSKLGVDFTMKDKNDVLKDKIRQNMDAKMSA